MTAYLRTSQNTGISVPVVFAPAALLLWLSCLIVAWFGMLLILGALQLVRGVGWACARIGGVR